MLLNHLSDHDICSHCNIPETSDDYFFHCPIYSNERLQLFRDTRSLHPLNCNILLFGNSSFTYSENITIVNAVHNYIKNSKRFTTQIFMFVLFCFKYTFHDLISHSLFSLIPLFFISKKAKTRIYQFFPNNFMVAKYTKSRVYTCHVYNCISQLGTRGEP